MSKNKQQAKSKGKKEYWEPDNQTKWNKLGMSCRKHWMIYHIRVVYTVYGVVCDWCCVCGAFNTQKNGICGLIEHVTCSSH